MKILTYLFLLMLSSAPASAQTGTLKGVVTDESGGVVAGAKVTLTSSSGPVRETASDKEGAYSSSILPSGDSGLRAKLLRLRPGGVVRRPGRSALGGASGGSSTGHRYIPSVSMAIRNIVNRDNPGPIIGNVRSPLFGRAKQPYGAGSLGGTGFSESADNRRLERKVRFRF